MSNETIDGEASEVQPGDVSDKELSAVFEQIGGTAKEDQAAPGAQPEEPQLTQADEIKLALFTAGQIVAMKYPSVGAVFSMEKCAGVAESVVPLLEHYGLKFSLTGVFALWAQAAMALLGLGAEIRAAVLADMAAAMAQQAKEEAAASG